MLYLVELPGLPRGGSCTRNRRVRCSFSCIRPGGDLSKGQATSLARPKSLRSPGRSFKNCGDKGDETLFALCHLSYSPKQTATGADGARTRNLAVVNDVVPSAFAATAIGLSIHLTKTVATTTVGERLLYQLSYGPTRLQKWNRRESNPRHVVSPAFVASLRAAGIEPASFSKDRILSPARLPLPPRSHGPPGWRQRVTRLFIPARLIPPPPSGAGSACTSLAGHRALVVPSSFAFQAARLFEATGSWPSRYSLVNSE